MGSTPAWLLNDAGGLMQIGGMLAGQSDIKDLTDGLRAVATLYDRCTLTRGAPSPEEGSRQDPRA